MCIRDRPRPEGGLVVAGDDLLRARPHRDQQRRQQPDQVDEGRERAVRAGWGDEQSHAVHHRGDDHRDRGRLVHRRVPGQHQLDGGERRGEHDRAGRERADQARVGVLVRRVDRETPGHDRAADQDRGRVQPEGERLAAGPVRVRVDQHRDDDQRQADRETGGLHGAAGRGPLALTGQRQNGLHGVPGQEQRAADAHQPPEAPDRVLGDPEHPPGRPDQKGVERWLEDPEELDVGVRAVEHEQQHGAEHRPRDRGQHRRVTAPRVPRFLPVRQPRHALVIGA